ncbi:hypothetical protein GOODEAATRI_007506 [Goodea atripinnis]|uniref:Uncharacterized protein n=1 Tax=Goodea atripinnis TaxID=208336 RepID=A0ABV0PM20_9TELE
MKTRAGRTLGCDIQIRRSIFKRGRKMLPLRSTAALKELLQSQLKRPLRAAVRAPSAVAAGLNFPCPFSGWRAPQPGRKAGFRGYCTPAKGHSEATSETTAEK